MKKLFALCILFFFSSCSLLTNSVAPYQKAIIELTKEIICPDVTPGTLSLNSSGIGNEKYYQDIFCTWFSCQKEVKWSDGSRIDALTGTYAIEIEFAAKWSNSIGQAIHYSMISRHYPGIAIIKTKVADQKYIDKLLQVCALLKIKVWQIESSNLKISQLN